jgi:hypothetical protein
MARTPGNLKDTPSDTSGKTQFEQIAAKNYRGRGKKRATAKSKARKTRSYRGK